MKAGQPGREQPQPGAMLHEKREHSDMRPAVQDHQFINSQSLELPLKGREDRKIFRAGEQAPKSRMLGSIGYPHF